LFAVAADGKTLAFSPEQSIGFVDTTTGTQRTDAGRYPSIHRGALSPDGKTAATASGDWKLRLWDTASGKVRHTIDIGAGFIPADLAFTPDSTTLIGMSDRPLFWDVRTGKEKKRDLPEAGGNSMALSADGNTIATGYAYDGIINLWDLKSGKLSHLEGCKGQVLSVAFSADGKRLVAGTGDRLDGDPKDRMDRAVYVWDLTTRKLISRMDGYKAYIDAVAISPDGKLVCSCVAAVCDADSGKELHRLGVSGPVAKVAFAPDGKTLALATGGYHPLPNTLGKIDLFDVKTMKRFRVLEGHQQRITSLTFAADSQTLLSTSLDGTALVWDLSKAER
jgi:WD40 repeat protein